MSAFYYSPLLTRCQIFLQLSTALSLDTSDSYVHYSDTFTTFTWPDLRCSVAMYG